MVERKSLLTNNQETKDCEPDSQFSEGMPETANGQEAKHYGRDFMLQLRLHPLSLQKPRNLPELEVIKDKLYLHQISESGCASADKYCEINNFPFSRSDYCTTKHEYPAASPYFNKMYPYCVSPHIYNGAYQNVSSKLRAPYSTYCNTVKKHTLSGHPCYKDFTDESMWAKRCYSSCEDMWSCYPGYAHSNFTIKKNETEAVPKTRKKLPIIDPVTGKNILEADIKTLGEQSNATDAEEIVKSSDESTEVNGCSYSSDYCSNGASDDSYVHVANKVYNSDIHCSSENKLQYEEMKDADTGRLSDFLKDKTLDIKSSSEETSEECDRQLPSGAKEGNHPCLKDTVSVTHSSAAQGNVHASIHTEKVYERCDNQKLFSKQVSKVSPNVEVNHPFDAHAHCQAQHQKEKEYHQHACKDCACLQSDAGKESFRQIKEKMYYILRQEQQKMAILQSFWRYKKYQLEETARNLDEKRIEIATFECNLLNKAKRLQDKEHWLENKTEMLQQKAQELAEQEKNIKAQESRIASEIQTPNNISKEASFSPRKFQFYNSNDVAWNEMDKKVQSNTRNDETGDNKYTYFKYYENTHKVAENSLTDAEICKSETSAIDELEKNIVMMEKLHSSHEVGDNVEIKSESFPSLNIQNKNENVAKSVGYSKGRRYFPEHIKYWLNKRDTSST